MSSGIFTADFLFSLEKRIRIIQEKSFAQRLTAEDIWYTKLMKAFPMQGKSERFNWLIDTASIEQLTPNDGGEAGGTLSFDELATVTTEYFPAHFGRATKMGKLKLMNMMQAGLDPLGTWAASVAAYGAYVPQRVLAQTILNGENITGYDGVNFFSASHPVHPLIPALGTYANLFTGGASGSYPGALPIDNSVTVDVALNNLVKGLAYVEGAIPAPNGAGDPRMLHVEGVFYPPQMQGRVSQLMQAETIAQAASGGAGSADVRAVLKKFQLAEPTKVKEFDGNRSYTIGSPGFKTTVTGSDTTWYVVAREAASEELGAFLWNVRVPFGMQMYTGDGGNLDAADAVLGRSNDIEYHYQGWMAVNVGHPYTIFKFKAS